ncbi:Mss4p nuclear export [Dimargaris verticillata]|uniref:Protein BCP1 n=1 Tax=Dimargaris verticillata TaxID=2761393 RepID=A0A9W8ED75_9FUNG|nr:Mss4p nuclear export [Dimargaris verticillata]
MTKRTHSEAKAMAKASAMEVDSPHDSEAELQSDSDSSSGSESDAKSTVDVEFDFFDPKESDFHAIKQFLAQLFGEDGEKLNLSEMSDLIVNQPTIGTCVKVVGEDDPYALLTVLNFNHHGTKPSIAQLKDYLINKAGKKSPVRSWLEKALLPDNPLHIGLVIHERLMNMPPQIAPPMFKMLGEEIEWAVEDREPYDFSHYLVISKVYRQVAAVMDEDDDDDNSSDDDDQPRHQPQPPPKNRKKGKFADTVFYHQPEEELLAKLCDQTFDYNLSKNSTVTDSKRAFNDFGIATSRRCFILSAAKMKEYATKLADFVQLP